MILRVLALVLGVSPVLLQAAPEDYAGKSLRAIEFAPEQQPLSRKELLSNLALRLDAPLNLRELGDALKRLHATGRFDDIVAEAEPVDGGVKLVVRTTPAWFVGSVSVAGVREPPNAGQLANATQLDLGRAYVPRDVDRSVQKLVETLKANGYFHPKIFSEFEGVPEYEQVNIRFDVETGARAKFARPVLSGDLLKSEDSLIRSTRWRSWLGFGHYSDVTSSRVQTGVDRLRKAYREKDYLTSKVFLERLDQDEARNVVTPVLHFEKGPRTQVRVEGAKVSRGKLRQLVPVYQELAVDKELLREGARNIEQYFQTRGYFEASVDFDLGAVKDNEQVVQYNIDHGERSKLVKIEFLGNRYFDKETLRERMYIRTASLLQYRYGRVSEDLLKKDRETIADLYRSNGFRGVAIGAEIVAGYQGRKNQVAVQVAINEGPQWFVSSLDITGVDLQYYDYLKSILQATPGQPYSDVTVAGDRDTILSYYNRNGYPEAAFEFTAKPAAEPDRVDLRYTIDEGPRRFVRAVVLNGLNVTREKLVQDRIKLSPDQPLSLNAITDSQRALSDLGIFAKVDVAIQNAEGREREKYVLFEVEEARRYSLDFGFGAELGQIGGSSTDYSSPGGTTGFSPRVSFGVSRLNVFGIGHTASLNSRWSNIQRRAVISYLAPRLQSRPNWSVTLSGLYDWSRNVRTFTSQREGGSVQLSQKLTKATTLQYRVSFQVVNLSALKIDPTLVPVYSSPERVVSVSASHILDRRDDPAEPRRGFYNTVDFSLSQNMMGLDARFVRLIWKNSTYHRVTRQVVFARSLTVGMIGGLNESTTPLSIPLAERIYGGGATTHRGFPENQAGPRDPLTGFPIGGSASFFNNLELRFPLVGENLGGVLFHDLGNVFTSVRDISLRYSQPTQKIPNIADPLYDKLYGFNYTVQAVGMGIRYRTPVGPLRLDLAFAPNTPRFRGISGTPDQIIKGLGQTTMQRINRFQFHFSIGQTF